MSGKITIQDVKPANDGTVATEFALCSWRDKYSYWLGCDHVLYGPTEKTYTGTSLVALNPNKPKPDWEPPEFLLPGWVFRSTYDGHWQWSENNPKDKEGRWQISGIVIVLQPCIDTSDWPDVDPEHSLYECRGPQPVYVTAGPFGPDAGVAG